MIQIFAGRPLLSGSNPLFAEITKKARLKASLRGIGCAIASPLRPRSSSLHRRTSVRLSSWSNPLSGFKFLIRRNNKKSPPKASLRGIGCADASPLRPRSASPHRRTSVRLSSWSNPLFGFKSLTRRNNKKARLKASLRGIGCATASPLRSRSASPHRRTSVRLSS